MVQNSEVSLFTREWIEIAAVCTIGTVNGRLPLYEGVDWNQFLSEKMGMKRCLPLYEGVDWNSIHKLFLLFAWVSLFTREWIEISSTVITVPTGVSLPLYEGVDWNAVLAHFLNLAEQGLPLYEGVDWNPFIVKHESKRYKVSLFTREWIEMNTGGGSRFPVPSPSLRGSGLKWKLFS